MDSCINTNTMFLAQAWSDVVTDGNRLAVTHIMYGADKLNSDDSLITLAMRAHLLFTFFSQIIANDLVDLAASDANIPKDCSLQHLSFGDTVSDAMLEWKQLTEISKRDCRWRSEACRLLQRCCR